jgi:4-amino-4-deoxy-L-arabinose transferase-like glycosyltransferase
VSKVAVQVADQSAAQFLKEGGKLRNEYPTALWKWSLRLWAVALALAYNWIGRYSMNVDGISYLDMANAYMRGDLGMAVNSYWAAGYAWILGVFLQLFHVSPYRESTAVHLVNVVIFIATLVSFEYFVTGVIQLRARISNGESGSIPFTEWTWWVLAYLMFMTVNAFITPVTIVTPDLCVEAIVLLGSGIVVRIALGRGETRMYVFLGAVLGVGYLIKSPMFPMGLVYLGIAFLVQHRSRRIAWRTFAALAIFLAISSPYILVISRAAGRPTIGENARITYGHYVLGIRDFSYWKGQIPGTGTPRHGDATRKLMSAPEVYEFDSSPGGTLPPFYNPPYWADGLRLHLNWRGQLYVLRDSANELLTVLFDLREFVLVFLVLLFAQESARGFLRRLLGCWFIWLPGLIAVAMYALVHIELRFLGGYVLLFFAAISFALEFPNALLTRRLFRAVALALLVLVGYRLLHEPGGPLQQAVPPVQWSVAQSLAQRGVRPGDRVAEMLFHTKDVHYWAHLAGVTIVAEIPYEEESRFWASSPEIQRQAEEMLAQTGAKVLVTQNPPTLSPDSGWERIPGTDYALLPLNQ